MRPQVYDFTKYNDYLVAVQNSYTHRGMRVSLPVWAKKLGYSSPRSVGMILKGQRLPTEEFLFRLSRDLHLSDHEYRYLELLVLKARFAAKKRNLIEINEELDRSNPHKVRNKKLLKEDIFQYVSSWHHFVIFFLSQQPGFKEDPAWIASQLSFKLSDFQIKEAIQCLLNLRLLRRNSKTGLLERSDEGEPTTEDDIPSVSIKRFHMAALKKAMEALQTQDLKDREFGSILLPMDPRKIPQARAMIRQFRDQFNQKFFEAKGPGICQLNLNFFSYTKQRK